jgi:hypothetical protein
MTPWDRRGCAGESNEDNTGNTGGSAPGDVTVRHITMRRAGLLRGLPRRWWRSDAESQSWESLVGLGLLSRERADKPGYPVIPAQAGMMEVVPSLLRVLESNASNQPNVGLTGGHSIEA